MVSQEKGQQRVPPSGRRILLEKTRLDPGGGSAKVDSHKWGEVSRKEGVIRKGGEDGSIPENKID